MKRHLYEFCKSSLLLCRQMLVDTNSRLTTMVVGDKCFKEAFKEQKLISFLDFVFVLLHMYYFL